MTTLETYQTANTHLINWMIDVNEHCALRMTHNGDVLHANAAMYALLNGARNWLQCVDITPDDLAMALHDGPTIIGSEIEGTHYKWHIAPTDDGAVVVIGYADRNILEDTASLRKLLDNADLLVSIADASGNMLYVNQTVLDAFELTPEEAYGSTYLGQLPEEYFEKFSQHSLAATVERPSYTLETPTLMPDNSTRWFTWTVQVIFNADETRAGYLSVGRDITEQYLHEQEREQHMRDLNEFAHNVAHDLKHPIHTLLTYLELISDDDTLSAENQMMLSRATTVGHQMTAIVKSLLRLGELRQDEIVLEPINIGAIIDNVLQRTAADIEQRNAAITVVDNHCTPPLGDAAWVEEALANYVSNALKYGGTPPHIRIACAEKEGYVFVYVDDNGPGVPQEQWRTLFQQPAQRNDDPDSYGIGLPIVNRVMKRHDGKVGVEHSEILGGSRFYFALPLRGQSQS